MATTVLGLKTLTASDPVDYNEINDNYNKIDNGVKTAFQGRAAHNLLDNSDFTNPVNQRGATTATLGKYFIDRWSTESFPSGPSITIDSNGLTLLPTTSSTAGIYQILPDYENRKGKVHTFAICVDNVWKCVSFTMGNFGAGYLIHGLYFFSVDNQNILIRNNASDTPVPITIQRVALYEGSYTADTLPAYQPKGYAAELAEAQRYYIHDMGRFTQGIIMPSGVLRVSYPVPTTMRTNPTVIVNNLDNAVVFSNGYSTVIVLTACSFYNKKDNAILVDFSTNINAGDYKHCVATTYATSISLSADL